MREKYEQFLSKNSKMQSVEAYAKHKLSVSIKRHRVPLTCCVRRRGFEKKRHRMKKCGLSSYFFLSPVAGDYFFMGDFWATCLAALHINSIISINVLVMIIFRDTLYFLFWDGGTKFLRARASSSCCCRKRRNGNFRPHTHKLYLQRRNITLEEALLNIFLELKKCFGQDNFKDIWFVLSNSSRLS